MHSLIVHSWETLLDACFPLYSVIDLDARTPSGLELLSLSSGPSFNLLPFHLSS